jgi:hypothetical protein
MQRVCQDQGTSCDGREGGEGRENPNGAQTGPQRSFVWMILLFF